MNQQQTSISFSLIAPFFYCSVQLTHCLEISRNGDNSLKKNSRLTEIVQVLLVKKKTRLFSISSPGPCSPSQSCEQLSFSLILALLSEIEIELYQEFVCKRH